ncbi:MAG: hypothetical protein D6799_06710, partial [Bacteroidetes bacterium]
IKDALLNAHPYVTRTVIEQTKKIPAVLKNEYFQALQTTRSYVNIEKLMWLLYENFPNEYSKILTAVKNLKHSPNDRKIEITALSIEYLQTKNKDAVNKIVMYASPSFEFLTKINAFHALMKIDYDDDRVNKYLKIASNSANHRLANVAKEVLEHFQKIKK